MTISQVMTPTRLSHAILAAANADTVRALAARCDLSPSTLSKLVSTQRRIDVDTLQALCTRTPPDVGLKLLLAHLHDEVERAGRDESDVIISGRHIDTDDDLTLLADEMKAERARRSDYLRAVIHDLAEMVRGYRRRVARGYPPQHDTPLELVADHKQEKMKPSPPKPDAPGSDAAP